VPRVLEKEEQAKLIINRWTEITKIWDKINEIGTKKLYRESMT
jgi:hypothetical protein